MPQPPAPTTPSTTETHDDAAHEHVTLRGARTRLTIYPGLGGKIGALDIGGRDWLWTSDVLPYRIPVEGTSYVETADSGGWDECFPTVGPCVLSTESGPFSGTAMPDHGELWSQRCVVHVDPDGRAARCSWRSRLLPAIMERMVRILDDDSVALDYRVTNAADAALPFLWSAHPLFPLRPGTRLTLPADAPMRVWASHGLDVLDGIDDEHRWPHLRLRSGGSVDVSAPGALPPGVAVKLFLTVADVGEATLKQDDAALGCWWSGVSHFGLWLNNRGWTPFADAAPYQNLAFEPCIGAPDSLECAMSTWRSEAWLDVGASRAWSLRLTAR